MLKAVSPKSAAVTRAERKGNALLLYSERGTLRLLPQAENIVRVSYAEETELRTETGIGFCPNRDYSAWSFEETPETVELKLPKLVVSVKKESGAVQYRTECGKLLAAETENGGRVLEGFDSYRTVADENTKVRKVETADGVKSVVDAATRVFDKRLFHTRLSLRFQKGEHLWGLGQEEDGILDLRGTTQYLHQANRKIAVPFLLSSKGYGLLFSTAGASIFSDTQDGSYFYTDADLQMDFYVIRGDRLDEIVAGYRMLTGKAAMLPRWAFGFLQSQERYETQEEVLRTAREYRKRKLGLDCVVQDWCYWRDGEWGQKDFDPVRYPDPEKMAEELHEEKVRLMVSIWPNVSRGTENYRQFRDAGLLLPASEIYNAFSPEGRAMYWRQVRGGLARFGVDAWWCDSSEPFTPEWSHPVKPVPAEMYREFVENASSGLPRELINAYGLVHARGIWEGQKRDGSSRVMNLTRSTYTGGQKYGVVLWSGDISASWETLKKQIAAGLNFCAAGFPYWTLDIGAFFVKRGNVWFWNGGYDEGNDDLGYAELFVRWFQFGAFLPVFRSHGTDVRREMWEIGKRDPRFYDALVKANRLRYSLIPYLYSCAAAAARSDSTIMRMLAFDFPNDETALGMTDEYMFGPGFLVCPVTEPMYFGVHSRPLPKSDCSRSVYLPGGCVWYDFYTGRKYEGGRTVRVSAPLDRIPLFVRGGSIIPWTEPLQSTDEAETAKLFVSVYPGADGAFSLYEDAGDGYGFEKGEYTLTRFLWNDAEERLSAEGAPREFTRKDLSCCSGVFSNGGSCETKS
jgi:alpha-D-xyloside xylohydrolase